MAKPADDQDRRVRRTRESILRAFGRLVFERRYESIRIADLTAAAGVGRATFYEHFHGKEDVLLAAMDSVLLSLSSAAVGRGSEAYVRSVLDHVWQQRATGRIVLNSTAATKLQRRLASMIETRLEGRASDGTRARIAATAIAAAQLAILRTWIAGGVSCSAATLAREMIDCSRFARR